MEDHNLVRKGIRALLEGQAYMRILEEAKNGEEALYHLKRGLKPDIVVSDLAMPKIDGICLTQQIKIKYPEIKVLILSMFENERYLTLAFDAGASAYVLKKVPANELIFAIHHVSEGYHYICSELAINLLSKIPRVTLDGAEKGNSPFLTKREKEILALIAEGYTNSEISEMLFTSRRTVEGHRQKLIEKTGARNTAALIRFAVKSGIIA